MARGPATAAVIPFRTGRPSKADDLSLELAARAAEEAQMAEAIAPLVARLRLMAAGPVAVATVSAVEAALTRHARRWTPQPPEAA